MSTLSSIDWVVVALYFAAVFGVAFYVTRQEKTRSSSADYFLGGRNVGWFVIGASLFASNIGSEHLVGLAGTAAASGVTVAQFEVLAAFLLLILGWVFVPFYLRSGVYTMPEFLERRYSSTARWYLAIISIVGYVLTKISVTIAAGGIVFEALMGIDFWTGAMIVVVAHGYLYGFRRPEGRFVHRSPADVRAGSRCGRGHNSRTECAGGMGRHGRNSRHGLLHLVEAHVRSGFPLDRHIIRRAPSWVSGTGARTSLLSSACCRRAMSITHARAPFSPGTLKSCRCSFL